jgi:hypothetical protein
MNKKTFLILAIVVAMALPSAALAKADFSLGGYIKLDAFWDSTQEAKNMNTTMGRNNAAFTQHGHVKFTSQSSRFNFTIKGPKLWGATTTGFFEMDMDAAENGIASAAASASNSYTPRLRHAMFRLTWPGTELLFGQYWSLFSQWYPELCQDGPFQMTGTPTARLPQIRLTQHFAGAWTVTGLIGEANSISQGETYTATVTRNGAEATEAPQVQAQVQFKQDLWGKAAWYGKPTPFTAQITGGWQRGIIQDAAWALSTTDQNNYVGVAGSTRHQYLDPWVVAGSFFIPVIPTHSANLAGTAALQTSWWVGQGVEAFGWVGSGSQVFRWSGTNAAGVNIYDVDLMNRFGGQVVGQYYFTNQWFTTAAWGFSKAFGAGLFETDANAPNNKANAIAADAVNYRHEFDLCLWYRPIQAFKFGLQYAYARCNYFQNTTVGSYKTNLGEAHRVEFVGLFFF